MIADQSLHVPAYGDLLPHKPDDCSYSPVRGRLHVYASSLFHASLSWLKLNAGHVSVVDFGLAVVVVEHPLDLFLIPVFIACTDADDLGFAIVHVDDIDYGFHASLSWVVLTFIT